MPFITLTTDFGEKDPYVGAVKGAIYSVMPEIKIVDISHMITPFHITEASYVVKNAYYSFPKGTIHIIGVDAELTPENAHIAVFMDGHYFITADNGVMSLLVSKIKPDKIVEINIHDRISSNFPVLEVFVQAACHIARGGSLDVIGKQIDQIKDRSSMNPSFNEDKGSITGSIIYIDNYGNAVSNITRDLFDKIGRGRSFELEARNNKFKNIYDRYSDSVNFENKDTRDDVGKKLAIFNTAGYLEIATYKCNPITVGSAHTLLGLNLNTRVTINFNSQ